MINMNMINKMINIKLFLANLLAPVLAISPFIPEENIEQVKPKTEMVFEQIRPNLAANHGFELKDEVKNNTGNGEFNNASAYLVMNFDTGEIIAEKNSTKKLPIASLTKIMTAVVALDLAGPDEYFKISQDAANIVPTKIGVVSGEKMSVKELLYAVLLTSANDAAEAIKEGVNQKYGGDIFIKAMNEKASVLGLENTSFDNPQGFDGQKNYSTARDLAILSHYALTNYPLIPQIVKDDYEFLAADKNHKQFDLYNWNGLIGVYPNASGVKIGNTGKARVTTIVLAEREGKRVLSVLLGAPGVLERDLWTAQLLDIGFKTGFGLPPIKITEAELKRKYSTWRYWN